MKKLHISTTLALPPNAVTSTLLVYGGKGQGKTNFGTVLVEEFASAALRFVVIDPMGVFWGLRHDSSGRGKGVEVLILGGIHGDLPIEPTAGTVVADLVVDEDVSVIVDISRRADGSMWSISERIRFVTAFSKRFYQRQGESRRPINLVIDEAARFAPQIVRQGESEVAACMGAIAVLVEEGRNVGIGVTLLTQRSARLNKDVAELADCMISFRIIGPNSIRAVLDWLGEHVEKSRIKELSEKLRSLPRGTALVVSPGWLEFEGIVPMRKRNTFDSSATPEAGKTLRASGHGAKPNLAKYRERMAEVLEEQKANDPKALRARIAELEKGKVFAIAAAPIAKDEAAATIKKLRADLADKMERHGAAWSKRVAKERKAADVQIKSIEKLFTRFEKAHDDLDATVDRLAVIEDEIEQTGDGILDGIGNLRAKIGIVFADADAIQNKQSAESAALTGHRQLQVKTEGDKRTRSDAALPAKVTSTPGLRKARTEIAHNQGDGKMRPAHQRILNAIAWWRSIGTASPSANLVTFIAKTSSKSSAFKNDRSALRTAGLIEYTNGGLSLTKAGAVQAEAPSSVATLATLHERIRAALSPAQTRLLDVVITHRRDRIHSDDLAKMAGTSATSSAYKNDRSRLSSMGLIRYPTPGTIEATDTLFPEGLK